AAVIPRLLPRDRGPGPPIPRRERGVGCCPGRCGSACRRPIGLGAVSEVREYPQSRFQRPPGACELLLVRHGESAPARDDRPFPLVDGHGDPELSPAGREQALGLAERLGHEDIAAIYVTTLR